MTEGSDGIERNSTFNNRNVLNVLAGREWKLGDQWPQRIYY